MKLAGSVIDSKVYGHVLLKIALAHQLRSIEEIKVSAAKYYARNAVQMLEQAAVFGSAMAALNLATIYEKGLPGIKLDSGKALEWYNQAVALGDAGGYLAAHRLSEIFYYGELGVVADKQTFNVWCQAYKAMPQSNYEMQEYLTILQIGFQPRFTSQQSCIAHYHKHGAEFNNYNNFQEYEQNATDIIFDPASTKLESAAGGLYFRKVQDSDTTFEFVATEATGKIKTLHTKNLSNLNNVIAKADGYANIDDCTDPGKSMLRVCFN